MQTQTSSAQELDASVCAAGPLGISAARVFCFFSLVVMIGALLASAHSHPLIVLIVALLPLLARPLCNWPLKVVLALALALVASFVWGQYRQQCTDRCGASLFSIERLRNVRLIARVEQVKEKCADDSRSLTLIARAIRLESPVTKPKLIDGRVLAQIDDTYKGPVPVAGDLVELCGVISRARQRNFSFEFDEVAWLARQDVMARLSGTQFQVRILPPAAGPTRFLDNVAVSIGRAIATARRDIVKAHRANLGDKQGGLFTSMVLGDRVVSLDENLKQQFARIGLSHLLAASGLNLTIIVTAALFVCRFFKPAGWLSTWLSFACVVLFTSFAGAGPSVSRAAMMCLIALWAKLAFVKLGHGSALAIALLIALTLDPQSVADVGLQLSYGATFGIIYIYPLLEKAWLPAPIFGEEATAFNFASFKITSFIAALSCVVIAAQLAVLPVQLSIFQQLSLLVVPANLLVEPVVVPLTIIGFVSSILAVVANCPLPDFVCATAGTLCFALDWLARFLLAWLMFAAENLAALPSASLLVARPQAAHIIIYYLVMAGAIAATKQHARAGAWSLSAAALILCLTSYIESPLLEIFCARGQMVVNVRNRSYVVVDTSRASDTAGQTPEKLSRSIKSYLRFLKNRGLAGVGKDDATNVVKDNVSVLLSPARAGDNETVYCSPESEFAIKIKSGTSADAGSEFGSQFGSQDGSKYRPRIGSKSRFRRLPAIEIVSTSETGETSSLLVVPPGRKGGTCFTIGSFATERFLPCCDTKMPFAMPLTAVCENSHDCCYVSLRL